MATAEMNNTVLVSMRSQFKEWVDRINNHTDPRNHEWPLIESPGKVVAIVVLYLLMVRQGPRFMRDRKPLQLQKTLVVYNSSLVVLSVYMVYEFLMSAYLSGYGWACQAVDFSDNPLALRMSKVSYIYFLSKIVEIFDTIFFIVRKKWRQLTFLHVYHHATMIPSCWVAAKFVPGGEKAYIGALNSLVHVFMYAYYALAALGPSMQKHLWWKKYITKFQIAQFVAVLGRSLYLLTIPCNFPKFVTIYSAVYPSILIFLFGNFYKKSYGAKSAEGKAHVE